MDNITYITDYNRSFGVLSQLYKDYRVIVVIGKSGIGKTMFTKRIYPESSNCIWVNKENKKELLSLKYLSLVGNITMVYDDKTISKNLLQVVVKNIHQKNKLIVLIEKTPPYMSISRYHYAVSYVLTEIDSKSLLQYLKDMDVDMDLIKDIFKNREYTTRKIQQFVDDGFMDDNPSKNGKNNKFYLDNPFLMSMYVAENLEKVKMIDRDLLIEADKLKFINNEFYVNFLSCFKVNKMKLRYPKQFMEIIKQKV